MKTKKTPLENAVEQTPDVVGHFCKGIQAVKNEHRQKIVTANPRKLTGSVDIDKATLPLYPDANRWDYAIEYGNSTYFIEFHPAATSNVTEMMEKMDWLNWWLQQKAPLINILKPTNKPYHWVATGRIKILTGSKQYKQLATIGLLPKKTMSFK